MSASRTSLLVAWPAVALAMLLTAGAVGAATTCAPGDSSCCRTNADCDDGDPCTIDTCAPTTRQCTRDPIGLDVLRAAIARALAVGACGAGSVPPRLQRLVAAADALAARAEGEPGAATHLTRAALRRLRSAARLAAPARTQRLDPACAEALHAAVAATIAPARCLAFPEPPGAADAPFACLSTPGPLVTISGTHRGHYSNRNLRPGTRLDLRQAVFLASPANRYPVSLDGGSDICVAGGAIRGEYDRTLGWSAMHDVNNAAVAFASPTTVDGVRIDDVTDGLRPRGAGPFAIREVWLSYVRDDCVENDHYESGTIDDSLFDGCYVAVSERASSGSNDDGRNGLLTIRRSLLRLEPMPGPRDGNPSALGHGEFFKWDDHATGLALHDDVFLAEQVGVGGPDTMGVPASRLAGCSNNVMVWLGTGPYPAPLPSCFTVTRDRAVWDDAVARWKETHPHVADIQPRRDTR